MTTCKVSSKNPTQQIRIHENENTAATRNPNMDAFNQLNFMKSSLFRCSAICKAERWLALFDINIVELMKDCKKRKKSHALISFTVQNSKDNPFRSNYIPTMRRGYDSDDGDFASAVAASAHAIHSLEQISSKGQLPRANTRKQEPIKPQQGGSMRKASIRNTGSSSSFRPPAISSADDHRRKETSTTLRRSESKAEAWEKAQIAKIRKRYEKLQSEIQAWENEKKLGEKHRMERKKGDLELRKSRNLKHYYNKIARIDHIAKGAREQVEEKQKHEESIVKDKARQMKSTGKAPVSCFCF